MTGKVVPLPFITAAEQILVQLHLELAAGPSEQPLSTLFECQRCEWRGQYPPFSLVPEEQCEFPHCPECGSLNVILVAS